MLLGLSYLNLDAKNRFVMPIKYREEILADHEGKMVLTADHGGKCLALRPMTSWEVTVKLITEMNPLDKGVKDLIRVIFGYATVLRMDGHGRILVSKPLGDFAKLDKKLVLVGLDNKFELWSEEEWNNDSDDRITSAEASFKKMPIASQEEAKS